MKSPLYRRPSAGALMVALLTVSCNAGPTGAVPPDPEKPAEGAPAAPRTSAFFGGAFLGEAASTPERIGPAIRDFAQMTGKQPAFVKTFHDLSCDFSATGWCGQVLREVVGTGSTSYVALDVRWPGGPRTGVLEPIVAGKADEVLARAARQIASVGGVVLLEPAWEMNGNWQYAWQGVENGNSHDAPARYREAWRRIVDIFRREGATNVRWVFNPNVGNPVTRSATGQSHWNWYGNYYPGDTYVDYVGAHGFNAPRLWGGPWQSPAAMLDGADADHMLSDLEKRFPGKPIIIGEMASDEGQGSAKADWIRDAYRLLQSHPRVVGAVWFHMDKETDWRVNSSAGALAAYREAMSSAAVQTAFAETPAAASTTRLAYGN